MAADYKGRLKNTMNKIKGLLEKDNMQSFFCLLYSFVSTLLFPLFVSDNSLKFSNSAFSLLLFFALFFLLNSQRKAERDRRKAVYTHILGLLLAIMTAFGYSLDTYGVVRLGRIFFPIVIYTHVFAVLLAFIWQLLEKNEAVLSGPSNGFGEKLEGIFRWLTGRPVVLALIIIAAWVPALLADFPGGFRYDATRELAQITDGYNGDFPLLHSAIITTLLPFFHKFTGTYNTGVAVYTILQMIMISAMYTHMLCVMVRRRVNPYLLLAALLYMTLFPLIQILAVQEVRDVFFSALLMYSVFLLYMINSDKERVFSNVLKPIFFSFVLTLTILARNNNAGFAALAIFIVLGAIIWLQNRRKYPVGATVLSLSLIVFYLLISLGLRAICQPYTRPSANASLSLPSQCIARAYLDNELSEEEDALFRRYIDVDNMNYMAENADGTKGELRNPAGVVDFAKFFFRTVLKYPVSCFNAIVANSQNMWFPPSVIDGYDQLYELDGQPNSEWEKSYYTIKAGQEDPVVHTGCLPGLLDFYSSIGLRISFEKIPVISMLFSIGFQFWLLLNCIFYNLYRKNRQLMVSLWVLLLYMVISAFGPLVLLRYYAAIFFSAPLLLVFTLQPSALCSRQAMENV